MERTITLLCLMIMAIIFAVIDWSLVIKLHISEEAFAVVLLLELITGCLLGTKICEKVMEIIGLETLIKIEHHNAQQQQEVAEPAQDDLVESRELKKAES